MLASTATTGRLEKVSGDYVGLLRLASCKNKFGGWAAFSRLRGLVGGGIPAPTTDFYASMDCDPLVEAISSIWEDGCKTRGLPSFAASRDSIFCL